MAIPINFSDIMKTNIPVPGFNVNPYADSDVRRPKGSRSLKDTFAMLKPGSIRPTNGYQADLTLWARAPSWDPRTSMVPAIYGWDYWASNDLRLYTTPPVPGGKFINVLNFSDFNQLKPTDTPFLLAVPLLGAYVTNKFGDPNEKAKLLQTACAWLRYCKDHNIPVSFWEISNESTMESNHVAHISAEQYADDVIQWSIAMKKVNPSIKIAANANTAEEFKTILDIAGDHIDAIVPHCYGPWGYTGGYDRYAIDVPKFTYNYDLCIEGLAMSHNQKKVDVVISETNIIDYSNTLTPENDVGKALMIFDLLGQLVRADRTSVVCFWETRSLSGIDGFPKLLRQNNRLYPAGFAFHVWAAFLPKNSSMVRTPKISGLVIFASTSFNRDVVWISNKTTLHVDVTVTTNTNKKNKEVYLFKGNGYYDKRPTLTKISDSSVVPPTSILIIVFKTRYDPVIRYDSY
jgi:hypothetical protein